jgi:hypothetical protein
VVRFFAGNTTITPNKEFVYNFYEEFGTFFACYECVYTDTTQYAPVELHNIILKYKFGNIIAGFGDKGLRSSIMNNLEKLGGKPYIKPENEKLLDNGLRKEFAINLAVFYYSFGRSSIETQKLFNKYYKYPDSKKVWAAFVKNLQYIKKDSDF